MARAVSRQWVAVRMYRAIHRRICRKTELATAALKSFNAQDFKSMLSLFKQKWFLALIGVVLLSLILWFLGPYVAFAEHRPLESIIGRLVGVLVLVVCWAVWLQIRSLRAQRSNSQLATAVASQSAPSGRAPGGAQRQSLDSRPLSERIFATIATLPNPPKRTGSL